MIIKEKVSIKNLNTFGIACTADYYAEVFSEDELKELISNDIFQNNKRLILGGGSNVLLTGNYKGLVIKINIPGIKIISDENSSVIIEAGAGVVWNDLVNYCIENNFGGIENLSLIPGAVGAAPMQNIGAYGQEIKNVVYNLEGIYCNDGSIKTFSNDECKFGYRDSVFKNELKEKFIITKIKIKLSKNPVINIGYGSVQTELEKLNISNPTIKDISNIISNIRRSKLPDPKVIGNAGSFFKNPVISIEQFKEIKNIYDDIVNYPVDENQIKLAAGWLIEKCGWKGKRQGDAGVHEKQSLVLVNYGKAGGKDILALAEDIKKSVYKKFNVMLKEEVNIY